MPESDTRLHQFTHDFIQAYQALPSPAGFMKTRTCAAQKIERSDGQTGDRMTQALVAEFFTYVCLRPLYTTGLTPYLAPEVYESGDKTSKGIDIIVSGDCPLIGFNVKLSAMKPDQIAPRHMYDPRLQIPVTYVHFGNWRMRPKELEDDLPDADFLYWLHNLAFPHIATSGKLPYIYHLRRYLYSQIIKCIHHYQEKTHLFATGEYRPGEQERRVFPKTDEELQILLDKLVYAEEAFTLINQQNRLN